MIVTMNDAIRNVKNATLVSVWTEGFGCMNVTKKEALYALENNESKYCHIEIQRQLNGPEVNVILSHTHEA